MLLFYLLGSQFPFLYQMFLWKWTKKNLVYKSKIVFYISFIYQLYHSYSQMQNEIIDREKKDDQDKH